MHFFSRQLKFFFGGEGRNLFSLT